MSYKYYPVKRTSSNISCARSFRPPYIQPSTSSSIELYAKIKDSDASQSDTLKQQNNKRTEIQLSQNKTNKNKKSHNPNHQPNSFQLNNSRQITIIFMTPCLKANDKQQLRNDIMSATITTAIPTEQPIAAAAAAIPPNRRARSRGLSGGRRGPQNHSFPRRSKSDDLSMHETPPPPPPTNTIKRGLSTGSNNSNRIPRRTKSYDPSAPLPPAAAAITCPTTKRLPRRQHSRGLSKSNHAKANRAASSSTSPKPQPQQQHGSSELLYGDKVANGQVDVPLEELRRIRASKRGLRRSKTLDATTSGPGGLHRRSKTIDATTPRTASTSSPRRPSQQQQEPTSGLVLSSHHQKNGSSGSAATATDSTATASTKSKSYHQPRSFGRSATWGGPDNNSGNHGTWAGSNSCLTIEEKKARIERLQKERDEYDRQYLARKQLQQQKQLGRSTTSDSYNSPLTECYDSVHSFYYDNSGSSNNNNNNLNINVNIDDDDNRSVSSFCCDNSSKEFANDDSNNNTNNNNNMPVLMVGLKTPSASTATPKSTPIIPAASTTTPTTTTTRTRTATSRSNNNCNKERRQTLEALSSQAHNNHHHQGDNDNDPLEIEIAPGHYVPFRGAPDVWKAIQLGRQLNSCCFECGLELVSVADCLHVVCSDDNCRMVNPVFDTPNGAYGACLGLKKDYVVNSQGCFGC